MLLELTVGGALLLAKMSDEETRSAWLPHDSSEQLAPLFGTMHHADTLARNSPAALTGAITISWLVVEPATNRVLNSEILPKSFDRNLVNRIIAAE